MISIKNLSKKYNNEEEEITAIENINLEVKKGEIFGIIGPSGAGKSTLIRTLNLLEKPSTGKIKINGEDITSLSEKDLRYKRQDIAMIFQHFNLLNSRTVAGNVSFPMEISNISKTKREKRVNEMLTLVGLEDKADSYPARLSGGQKQRVGIARALANSPNLLLSDEATSSLDPESTDEILNLLAKIRDELNLTIILITHEMEVIKEVCDRVAVIEKGKIIESGSVIDVFARPRKQTTRRFVENIFNLDLPPGIRSHFQDIDKNNGELLRVNFVGESTHKPLVSTLIKKYDIDVNILYGNIEEIQDTPFGTLIIKLTGDHNNIEKGIEFLSKKDLFVEVLENDRGN